MSMVPGFLSRLADPAVRNVLICGCGGGFDFVHGLLLLPELVRLGKTVTVVSHSFGDVESLTGDATVVFDRPPARAKRVTARTEHAPAYAPEVHVCSFLDERLPARSPHALYATNARTFDVATLTEWYRQLGREHDLDAVVLVDGGSDSLMRGDEWGLGDPVEDAVSVGAVAALTEVPLRLLVCTGLGVDRHNGVSDGASLRAVAELTAAGGFRGAIAIEREHEGWSFYRAAVEHVLDRQSGGSVVTGAIRDACRGRYGDGPVPGRRSPDSLHVWPPMSMLFAFDVEAVAARSLMCGWIRDVRTPAAAWRAIREARRGIRIRRPDEDRLPEVEPLPGDL